MRHLWPLLALFLSAPAAAQTVGGIPGPGVRADDRSAQVRVAFAPGSDGREDRWAARLHYQRGINDHLRWRVVAFGGDFEGPLELTSLQGELQWEVDSDPQWGKALRFDARLTDGDDGADQLGLVAMNQFRLSDAAYARLDVFGNIQLGNDRSSGIGVELRGRLGYKLDGDTEVFLDSFNNLGRGANFGELKRNRERLGPGVSHRLGKGWSVLGGVLFGLNSVTPDTDVRVWLGKSFE